MVETRNENHNEPARVTTRYVFICAAGHAGSTLLNLLLGAHPEGLAVGEITHLPKNIAIDSTCSCGEPVSSCAFWRPAIDAYGQALGVDLWQMPYALDLGFIMDGREIDRAHQTRARMLWRKIAYGLEFARYRWGVPGVAPIRGRLDRAARNKVALFDFLLARTGKAFIVDSSKHYVDAMHLYEAAPDSVRIISLVRDGRAVFNSGLRRGLTPAAAMSAWQSPYARALPVLDRNVADAGRIRIRYEDLAQAPTDTLRQVSDFLGLAFDPAMVSFQQSGIHIANGNRMRLRGDRAIRLDERWKTELSPEMLDYFDREGGRLNRQLGYGT